MGGVRKVPAKQSKVKRRITMSPPFEAREYTPNGCQAEKSKSFFVSIPGTDSACGFRFCPAAPGLLKNILWVRRFGRSCIKRDIMYELSPGKLPLFYEKIKSDVDENQGRNSNFFRRSPAVHCGGRTGSRSRFQQRRCLSPAPGV